MQKIASNLLNVSVHYYPFGMIMPGRSYSSNSYRYGFQGQEKDDEVKGNGNSVNYKYRMHDARIGRFFAVDPLASSYPHNSPYAFSENSVIAFIELEGLEKYYAANGEYLGQFGDNTTIRVVNEDEIESTKSAFVEYHKNPQKINNYLGMYISSDSFSTLFTKTSDATQKAIFRTIFSSLGGSDNVNLEINESGGASCNCDGYGNGLNGEVKPRITISNHYNDQNDIEFLMHKEILHLTDGDDRQSVGATANDLIAHYTVIKQHKVLWNSTSDHLKRNFIGSMSEFLWDVNADANYFRRSGDAVSANFYQNIFKNSIRDGKSLGVEIDFSQMMNTYDGVNFPSSFSVKHKTQSKVDGKIINTGKHYDTD